MSETVQKQLLSLEEVSKLPAFPTATWQLKPHQQGLLPVSDGINISWEVHGEGPIKLIFICGLGFLKGAWQRQTLHFGHNHGKDYSVLLLDNRGMGGSSVPLSRYSTSIMASDALSVIDHVGWTEDRQLHVTGLSMGGMIAQELAILIPSRIASLNLCCTAAYIKNTSGFFENLLNRITMLLPKSPDRAIQFTSNALFPGSWLDSPDDAELPEVGVTPMCDPPPLSSSSSSSPEESKYLHFPTNFARFAAQEINKQRSPGFTKQGFLLQLVAAGWHHKSREQLRKLGDEVGRGRILVLHGTEDGMISAPHGEELMDLLRGEVEVEGEDGIDGRMVEGMGHGPIVERFKWFNELIEERCRVGERLSGR